MPRKRSKRTKTLPKQEQSIDLRPFLPGGSVERAYRQSITRSLQLLDFSTDDWLIEGRPVPNLVPPRARSVVHSAAVARLKASGLARRQAVIADDIARLRNMAKTIGVRSEGRPSGPSYEQSKSDFLMKVKAAIQQINRQGKRVTIAMVAEELGRDERTLQRNCRAWGYSSWRELRSDIIASDLPQ